MCPQLLASIAPEVSSRSNIGRGALLVLIGDRGCRSSRERGHEIGTAATRE